MFLILLNIQKNIIVIHSRNIFEMWKLSFMFIKFKKKPGVKTEYTLDHLLYSEENADLSFLMIDSDKNPKLAVLHFPESEAQNILAGGELQNEEHLFLSILVNLPLLRVCTSTDGSANTEEDLRLTKSLLAHLLPKSDYSEYLDIINFFIMRHLGARFELELGNIGSPEMVEVTSNLVAENIESILELHKLYSSLSDDLEYKKAINSIFWRFFAVFTSAVMLKVEGGLLLVDYIENQRDVTEQTLKDFIDNDLNYYQADLIKSRLRAIGVSPMVKKYDFDLYLQVVESELEMGIPVNEGFHGLFAAISLSYRNYLIRNKLNTSEAISEFRLLLPNLIVSILEVEKDTEIDFLDGKFTLYLQRKSITSIHASLVLSDPILDAIEQAHTIVC